MSEPELNWYKEAKYWEFAWMNLKSDYTDLVRATGLLDEKEYDSWFGDPLISHDEIISRIRNGKA